MQFEFHNTIMVVLLSLQKHINKNDYICILDLPTLSNKLYVHLENFGSLSPLPPPPPHRGKFLQTSMPDATCLPIEFPFYLLYAGKGIIT